MREREKPVRGDSDQQAKKHLVHLCIILFTAVMILSISVGLYAIASQSHTCGDMSPLWMFALMYLLAPVSLGILPTRKIIQTLTADATIGHLYLSSFFSFAMGMWGYCLLGHHSWICEAMRGSVLYSWCTAAVYWNLASGTVSLFVGIFLALTGRTGLRDLADIRILFSQSHEDHYSHASHPVAAHAPAHEVMPVTSSDFSFSSTTFRGLFQAADDVGDSNANATVTGRGVGRGRASGSVPSTAEERDCLLRPSTTTLEGDTAGTAAYAVYAAGGGRESV